MFLVIFLLGSVLALCQENQIDINSASAEKLDEIIWVGPATAEKIISERSFDSVDDLIRVGGIGEVKLQDIKEQNLACVNSGNGQEPGQEEKEEIVEEEESEEDKKSVRQKEIEIPYEEDKKEEKVEIKTEVIKLNFETDSEIENPKDIKIEEEKGISERTAIYGLLGFCVLLGFLFLGKKLKKYRNEFDE